MANAYFQFKHFVIFQDKCAMKVGTDGVLLGAWTPVEGVRTILDVGSGTGLLALMLAQRAPEAKITAVEIDLDASLQSMENIGKSLWSNRIQVVNEDFRQFAKEADGSFDLIVSNPPYFVSAKSTVNNPRKVARHTIHLNYKEFLEGAIRLLMQDGKLALILPSQSYPHFSEEALTIGLFETRRMLISSTPKKPVSRILSVWSRYRKSACSEEQMVLEINGRHNYSAEYLSLTKDFYL